MLAGHVVSTVRPSHASTVSPAGTVLACGFCAGPHTPFGNEEWGRTVRPTALRSKGWFESDVTVIVSVESRVGEYIGATPRPGAPAVAVWLPWAQVSSRLTAGAVVTKVSRNSGTSRNGWSALPSGGLLTPPDCGASDLPAVSPPLSTAACTTCASLSPRRYLAAKSPAVSARSAGLDCSPNENGMS